MNSQAYGTCAIKIKPDPPNHSPLNVLMVINNTCIMLIHVIWSINKTNILKKIKSGISAIVNI